MTVRELIEKLRQEDPDAEVHFAFPSLDHWGTEVRKVWFGFVSHNGYHDMDQLSGEDGEVLDR